MKKLLLFLLLLRGVKAFSQCPQSGLKIVSKECAEPSNLAISSINCTSMKVKWTGSKEQTYLVKATANNAKSDNATEAKVSEPACDNGHCEATIEVTEGADINWSVQAVCNTNGVTLYSTPVNGPQTYIPICGNIKQPAATQGIEVYPNPAINFITINYTGKAEGAVEFRIFDVNGKQVFTKSAAANGGNNNYQLDIRALPSGTYLLETANGEEKKQVKFVVMKK